MSNFRLVMAWIDVQPLLRQSTQHPELWNLDHSVYNGSDTERISMFANIRQFVSV